MENILELIRAPDFLVLDEMLGLIKQPSAVLRHLRCDLLGIEHFLDNLFSKQLAIFNRVFESGIAILLHDVERLLGLRLV